MSIAAIRGDWTGQIADDRFPLLQWLGGSEEAGVFLTRLGDGPQKATIKLVLADADGANSRMAGWLAAANLSHPNLIEVYATGRCEIDSVPLLYIVQEFADEVLAEIIQERALTPQEVREMLGPALDVLAYLHGKGFVHGRLKPSNIMAVGDRLKLSSDGLILAGAIGKPFLERTVYDAPENAKGRIGAATDVWSLGATLVEILTQRPPAWDGATDAEPVVPETIPQPFADVARECLRDDPAQRCTLGKIRDLLEPGTSAQRPRESPARTAPPEPSAAANARETRRAKGRAMALIGVAGVALAAICIWSILSHRSQTPSTAVEEQNAPATNPAPNATPAPAAPSPSAPAETPAPAAATPTPNRAPIESPAPVPAATPPASAERPAPNSGTPNGAAIVQVQPNVAPSALKTISGTVKVSVRLTVDDDGNVVDASLESAGPSKYFANKALDAARGWKFKPAQAASSWILQFQFKQSGITETVVSD